MNNKIICSDRPILGFDLCIMTNLVVKVQATICLPFYFPPLQARNNVNKLQSQAAVTHKMPSVVCAADLVESAKVCTRAAVTSRLARDSQHDAGGRAALLGKLMMMNPA